MPLWRVGRILKRVSRDGVREAYLEILLATCLPLNRARPLPGLESSTHRANFTQQSSAAWGHLEQQKFRSQTDKSLRRCEVWFRLFWNFAFMFEGCLFHLRRRCQRARLQVGKAPLEEKQSIM